MANNINILRFLTFVRNDILPYCDTVSKPKMTNRGVMQGLNLSFTKAGIAGRQAEGAR